MQFVHEEIELMEMIHIEEVPQSPEESIHSIYSIYRTSTFGYSAATINGVFPWESQVDTVAVVARALVNSRDL